MPIHDWSRALPGVFHDFHQMWTVDISRALNTGRLPSEVYAMVERRAPTGRLGALDAIAEQTPETRDPSEPEALTYSRKANVVANRHSSGHRVVAMIEVVSPGNKSTRHALRQFLGKAVEVLEGGVHLMVIDLLPPGRLDPRGIHSAIIEELSGDPFDAPPDAPLTLASYVG